MLKLRGLYAHDADGRDIDRFAAEFKAILKSFGHETNHAYIDYAWDNGLTLELAAWRAINLARDEELYTIADEILELVESLRYAEAGDFLDKIESYYLRHQNFDAASHCLMTFPVPERVFKVSGWPPETPPRYGFYQSETAGWSLILKTTTDKVFSVEITLDEKTLRFEALLPILEETMIEWQQRITDHKLLYFGAFCHFRDDLLGMAVFKEHSLVAVDAERRIYSHPMWI